MKVKVSYCIHGDCNGVVCGTVGGYEMEVGKNHLARICALCIAHCTYCKDKELINRVKSLEMCPLQAQIELRTKNRCGANQNWDMCC